MPRTSISRMAYTVDVHMPPRPTHPIWLLVNVIAMGTSIIMVMVSVCDDGDGDGDEP